MTQNWTPQPHPAPAKKGLGTGAKIAIACGVVGVLAVGGCAAVGIMAVGAVDKELNAKPSISAAPAEDGAAPKAAEDNGMAIMGQSSATLSNGLEISATKPEKFEPTEGTPGVQALNYTYAITYKNNGTEAVDLGMALTSPTADGGKTDAVYDAVKNVGMDAGGTLAPGQSTTYTYGFSTEKQATYVNVKVTPGILKSATFTHKF